MLEVAVAVGKALLASQVLPEFSDTQIPPTAAVGVLLSPRPKQPAPVASRRVKAAKVDRVLVIGVYPL
jgi:hypothetical protein